MITHHVEAVVYVAVLWLPAQRKAPLAAVAGVLLGEPVVPPALTQRVVGGPVAAHRRQLALVPAELIVGLDVDTRAKARSDTEHRRGQHGLLELHAGTCQGLVVVGVGVVDATGHEQAFTPVDHLVAQARADPLPAHVEAFAHPQVQQASLEGEVVAGVVTQPVAADALWGVERQRAGGIGGSEVADPGPARHEGEVFGHLQQQLMGTLEVVGEQVAAVVVQVALVRHAGTLRQAAGGHVVPGRPLVDQVAAPRLGTQAHACGDRGVEGAIEGFGFKGEPHCQWGCAHDDKA